MTHSVLYDKDADVLYVSVLPKRPAVSEEIADGVLYRHPPDSAECLGITIIDFLAYFATSSDWEILLSKVPPHLEQFFRELREDPSKVLQYECPICMTGEHHAPV